MRIAIAIAALLFSGAFSAAAPLGAGMSMPAITLPDQYDVEGSVNATTRCVVFSRDMDAGKIVKEALAEDPALLVAADGVVVSDIAAMPSLITKLFAVPAMRKRPYRMLLDREGKVTAAIPSEKGKVTLVLLDALSIQRVEYVDSVDALRTALRQAVEHRAASAAAP